MTYLRSFPRGRVIAALIRRDFLVVRSYRMALLFDVVYGLVGLALYFFISRTFEDVPPPDLHGAPTYFAFAAVGLALSLVVEAASGAIGQRLREEQLTGTLEALAAQPARPSEVCLGVVGFPFAFGIGRAVLYLGVAAVWMDLDVSKASWPGFALVLIAAAAALLAFGVLAGAVVLVFKRGEILASLAIFGMALASGALFPISALPDWLEPLGHVLPQRFAFDGARDALFRGAGWASDALTLGVFAVVGLPLSVWVFARALGQAKRSGSLAEY